MINVFIDFDNKDTLLIDKRTEARYFCPNIDSTVTIPLPVDSGSPLFDNIRDTRLTFDEYTGVVRDVSYKMQTGDEDVYYGPYVRFITLQSINSLN